MKIDFLIIGQGLAGSLLAWELIQRGCRVVIVDNGKENASKVAAGLINPVTGMRFVKTEGVDILLPAALDLYEVLNQFFKQQFFIEKTLLRILKSDEEKSIAAKRINNPEYRDYIKGIQSFADADLNIKALFGFVEQKQTGFLLTRPLLECLKEFFISNNSYRQSDFDYRDVEFLPSLRWQYIYPRQIIFCEGAMATQNPWFSWLPLQPVKGEILTLQHKMELPDKILNFGNWLIPLSPERIRVGATFDRENLNTKTTDQGKNEILESLGKLCDGITISVITEHEAGIRPCTMDRHPFIGNHPIHEQLSIFNGFGAKGSLQIPWYCKQLADNLSGSYPLPVSCNINRHLKSHFVKQ